VPVPSVPRPLLSVDVLMPASLGLRETPGTGFGRLTGGEFCIVFGDSIGGAPGVAGPGTTCDSLPGIVFGVAAGGVLGTTGPGAVCPGAFGAPADGLFVVDVCAHVVADRPKSAVSAMLIEVCFHMMVSNVCCEAACKYMRSCPSPYDVQRACQAVVCMPGGSWIGNRCEKSVSA
jgi:hypothetical protein